MGKFLTTKQISSFLGISMRTVHRHLSDLGGFKVGGQWRFRKEKFEKISSPKTDVRKARNRVSEEKTKMGEVMTPSEVAALLKIHIKTVYKFAEHGTIPGNRIGRGWRFSRQKILELVSSKNGNPETPATQ